jgi:hypothetical protein
VSKKRQREGQTKKVNLLEISPNLVYERGISFGTLRKGDLNLLSLEVQSSPEIMISEIRLKVRPS